VSDYFSIKLNGINLPVIFSVDQRIEANLAIMTGLYALVYDVENRLRFFIASKLEQKYGSDFIKSLPRKIRDQITDEKSKTKIFMSDTRNKDLEFVNFSDLKKIINLEDIISDITKKQTLVDKLDYLNEARTLIAHNNIIVTNEIDKIKTYCEAVKNIIE